MISIISERIARFLLNIVFIEVGFCNYLKFRKKIEDRKNIDLNFDKNQKKATSLS